MTATQRWGKGILYPTAVIATLVLLDYLWPAPPPSKGVVYCMVWVTFLIGWLGGIRAEKKALAVTIGG